jgi:hypothetical protein
MCLELLAPDKRVEEIDANKHGHDQAEEIGATHVPDEECEGEAHIFSMPMTNTYKTANMSSPSNIAKTSMRG